MSTETKIADALDFLRARGGGDRVRIECPHGCGGKHPAYYLKSEQVWGCHRCSERGGWMKLLDAVGTLDDSDGMGSTPRQPQRTDEPEGPASWSAARHPPRDLKHPFHGPLQRHWEIRDADGRLFGLHCRFQTDEGKKYSWWRNGWSLDGTRMADCPLYGEHWATSWNRSRPLVVVEGEKAADELRKAYPNVLGYVAGANTTPNTETIKPLLSYFETVVFWPDADRPRTLPSGVIKPPAGLDCARKFRAAGRAVREVQILSPRKIARMISDAFGVPVRKLMPKDGADAADVLAALWPGDRQRAAKMLADSYADLLLSS